MRNCRESFLSAVGGKSGSCLPGALGDAADALLNHPHVFCANASAGRTMQAFELLSRKVLDNIVKFLDGGGE